MPDHHTTTTGPKGPARFRKKPVEVEAIQWTGENRAEVEEFLRDKEVRLCAHLALCTSDAVIGDWVARDAPLRDCFVIRREAFKATYEPAEQGQPALSLGRRPLEKLAKELEASAKKWQRERAKCKQAEADDHASGKLAAGHTYEATWNYYEGLAVGAERAAQLVRELATSTQPQSQSRDLAKNLGDGGQGEAWLEALLDTDAVDQARIAAGHPGKHGTIFRPTFEEMRKGIEAAWTVALRILAANPSPAPTQPVPSHLSEEGVRKKLLGEVREAFFRELEAGGRSGDEEIPSPEIEGALDRVIERLARDASPLACGCTRLIQSKLTPLVAAIYEVGNIPDTDDVGAPQDIDGPALWRAVDALQREVASLSASSETGGAGGQSGIWFERNEHGRLEELRNGDEPTDAVCLLGPGHAKRLGAAEAIIRECESPDGFCGEMPDDLRERVESFNATSPQQSVPDSGEAKCERCKGEGGWVSPDAQERARNAEAGGHSGAAAGWVECPDCEGTGKKQPDPPGEVLGRERGE